MAAPVLFSQLAMGRIGADFCAAYPQITLDVVAEDRLVDLVEEQFDIAIRINPSPDSNLVGRCVARDRLVVVAAPEDAQANARRNPTRSRHRDVGFPARPLDARWRPVDPGAGSNAAFLIFLDDS